MTLDETLYRMMYLVRRTEETIAKLYPSDVIRSPIHLSLGQEAVSVGVCAALQPSDKVFGSYRSHALYLSKGGNLQRMMAELFGKATGCTGGWGGSMHLVDPDAGLVATSAVVASTIPLAAGYAYAEKIWGRDTVVACFFGDGALEEGAWHESANWAALKKLPVLFVCEDNEWAVHVHRNDRQRMGLITPSLQAVVHGMRYAFLDLPCAADPAEVHKAAAQMIQALRGGAGPQFLHCHVERWAAHVGPEEDWDWGYRQKPAFLPDPVAIAGARVEATRRAEVERAVEEEIQEAVEFATNSPWPKS